MNSPYSERDTDDIWIWQLPDLAAGLCPRPR
jgi:hypothetical protein